MSGALVLTETAAEGWTPWSASYRAHGSSPFQHPAALAALGEDCVLSHAGGLHGAYRAVGELAVALLEPAPPLRNPAGPVDLGRHLLDVLARTGAESVVHPLVYDDDTDLWAGLPGLLRRARRPSPAIDWRDRGAGLWARCCARLGGRARRVSARFDRDGYTFASARGEEAVQAMLAVERRSWKVALGQDLETRGQAGLYGALIRAGVAQVRLVVHAGRPAAYRLDARTGRRLFCLKWSFDESDRRVSPGLLLLARDLPAQIDGAEVDEVDLAGSPDHLKEALATHARPRSGLAWPPSAAAEAWLEERVAHDRRTEVVYAAGKGIRHVYGAA